MWNSVNVNLFLVLVVEKKLKAHFILINAKSRFA